MGNEHSVERDVEEDLTVASWLTAGTENPNDTNDWWILTNSEPNARRGVPDSAPGIQRTGEVEDSKAPAQNLAEAVLPGCCVVKGPGMQDERLLRYAKKPATPQSPPSGGPNAVTIYMEANDDNAKDGVEAEALLTTHLWNAPRDHVRVPLGGRSAPWRPFTLFFELCL